VVINAITDGTVYYNDPAEATGNRSLSIEQFKRGWKQRYIVIRPV
jgi:predicted double-glycine peptidase